MEVMDYLHSKVEEHVKTVYSDHPRDYIDMFLIEKNLQEKLNPGKADQLHFFTGWNSTTITIIFKYKYKNNINIDFLLLENI
jgi:hypothetical protein